MDQSKMLEWAGINFGEDTVYLIQKSLKKLAQQSSASPLKFFGKIYGTQKDYWVAQGQLPFSEEVSANPQQEARGQGVNKSIFWVTDSLLNDWIQLPDVGPEQLMVSRLLKHVFTGNLNGSIDSCPPFPGKERHLLRCQLARIQHAAEICPKGMYEIDEETGDEKVPEELPALGVEELKSLEAWGHRYPIILKAGRCSHKAPTGLDEEASAAWAEKMAEEDKTEERFKALNEDVPIKGLETAWIVKVCGDNQ